MTKTDFKNALADYDPWVYDRPPTREDGDALGFVEVWIFMCDQAVNEHWSCVTNGRPWRRIIKPKKG